MRNMIKYVKRKMFGYLVNRKLKKTCETLYVNRFSVVNKNTTLGNNVHFNGIKIRGTGRVFIGDNFHSGEECLLLTDMHNYRGKALPYDDTLIEKPIVIENNVWLGSRVIIIGRVTIGEGAIVQAGSVVVRDVQPLSIVGGNPAIEIKKRPAEEYYKLLSMKSFY